MKHCPACHRCYEDAQTACAEDSSALVESRPGPPLLAGKYRLEELLGQGGQGTAYEATALADGRSVIAVELLRAEVLADPQALARFHSAAQAAGRNNGQEVGEIRDSGPLPGGGAYVVMGLIDGEEDRQTGAATAVERADTPPLVEPRPDTGRLRQPGRNTGRLSKVAAEITQEVRRIPIPLPPAEAPRPAAAEGATSVRDAGATREVSAPSRPLATSDLPAASSGADRTAAPIDVDVPHETKRRRSAAFYLGLALIGIAFALLLIFAISRMRRGTGSAAAASPVAAQPAGSQATAPTPPPPQQTNTPSSGQAGSAATVPDGAPAAAGSAGGGAVAARSAQRGANREEEVREMIDDWVAAVVSRDVRKLMTFYAPELETFYDRRDLKSSSLRAELTRLFGRAESVEARVLGEPRITFEEGGRAATASVRVSYVVEDKGGKRRRGEATQELRLVKAGDGWKISGQRGENLLR